jgi:Aspartyl protease
MNSKLDITTLSDDPSTIAPWTTRMIFGKSNFTALLDTGASADVMRPDIADKLKLQRHECTTSRTSTSADQTKHECNEYVIADFKHLWS